MTSVSLAKQESGPRFEAEVTVADERARITGTLVALCLLVIATGMAYSLLWPEVVRHHPYWLISGDFWGTVRAAHWIGWGDFSYIYRAGSGLVTLPGFPLLLTPFAVLVQHLGLYENSPGVPLLIAHPTSWYVYGPPLLACATPVIFGAESLARHLGIGPARRRLIALSAAVACWPLVALWGHGEDALALGFAMLALRYALQGRSTPAGWLLGLALAMQLYVLALVPLFLVVVGARRVIPFVLRAALAPGFLLLVVLIPDPHTVIRELLNQPNYPTVDHPTPWMSIAPRLSAHVVAAGPGRLVGLAVAVGLAVVAWRRHRNPAEVVWLMAAAMAARCLTESVMDPYYVVPAVVLALIAGSTRGRVLLWSTIVAGVGLSAVVYQHGSSWTYWLEMAGCFAALLAVSWPARAVSAAGLADDLHAQSFVVPFGELGDSDDGVGHDATRRPQGSGGVEQMSGGGRLRLGVDGSVDAGEASDQQSPALGSAVRSVLGKAEGNVVVELEEAQFRMHLEDGPLPVGRHLARKLGHLGKQLAPDGAHRQGGGVLTSGEASEDRS